MTRRVFTILVGRSSCTNLLKRPCPKWERNEMWHVNHWINHQAWHTNLQEHRREWRQRVVKQQARKYICCSYRLAAIKTTIFLGVSSDRTSFRWASNKCTFNSCRKKNVLLTLSMLLNFFLNLCPYQNPLFEWRISIRNR